MTDLTKILAENQKVMLKLIAPVTKKFDNHLNIEDSDSHKTFQKNTPLVSRNSAHLLLLHWPDRQA